jgi:hypothetical protein
MLDTAIIHQPTLIVGRQHPVATIQHLASGSETAMTG